MLKYCKIVLYKIVFLNGKVEYDDILGCECSNKVGIF